MRITKTPAQLTPKLEAVLARLCCKLGKMTKTKAVKLPYLVDVAATAVLGHRITEGTHEAWEYGVVTKEVYKFITHGEPGPHFRRSSHGFSEGGQMIELAEEARSSSLTPEETAVVDWVAEQYGRLGAAELGTLTKQMNLEIEPERWSSSENPPAAVDEEAFARLSPSWQSFWQALPALSFDNASIPDEPIEDAEAYFRKALRV